MRPEKNLVLSHLLLVLLCLLILLPGKKEVQSPAAMFAALALMEGLYLARIMRHRGQLTAASDLMILIWVFLILWEGAVTKLALLHPVLDLPEDGHEIVIEMVALFRQRQDP